MPLIPLCKKIGGRVKKVRQLRKMKQTTLAAQIDYDERSIQGIENGTQPTCFPTLEKIANVLEVDIEVFVTVSDIDIDKLNLLPFNPAQQ